MTTAYKIQLPNFEGPFDLLLYFIKRDEVNIYDIPISKITEEFLNYLKVIKLFDLELAGDFILMASTLMYIKSQMLLPREISEDGTIVDDPRTELVNRLLEYKQYKEASQTLEEMADETKYLYYRALYEAEQAAINENEKYKNTSLYDLIRAFNKVIERQRIVPKAEHVVQLIPVTLDEQKEYITTMLSKQKRFSFYQSVSTFDRTRIVVTFLAILELVKNKVIAIVQDNVYDDIFISEYDKAELV